MSQNLSEIKEIIHAGSNPTNILASILSKNLDNHLDASKITVSNQPLFLKTMFYYKLITKDVFDGLTNEDFNLEDTVKVVSKHSSLIQSDIVVSKIIIPSLSELSYVNSREVSGLDIKVASVENGEFKGASHPFFMGLLFLNYSKMKNENVLAMSIVHELAHQELFLLNMLDRLVTNSSNPKLIHSPYQGKERPTIGRLHSAHALFRMIKAGKIKNDPSTNEHIRYLKDTIVTFNKDELTELGSYLIDIYKSEVEFK